MAENSPRWKNKLLNERLLIILWEVELSVCHNWEFVVYLCSLYG